MPSSRIQRQAVPKRRNCNFVYSFIIIAQLFTKLSRDNDIQYLERANAGVAKRIHNNLDDNKNAK